MNKRAVIAALVAGAAILVVWKPASAAINRVRTGQLSGIQHGTTQERQADLDVAAALKSSNLGDRAVLLRVNGEAITMGEYNQVKAKLAVQRKYQGKPSPSDAEIRANLIRLAVLRAEAKSLGVFPTEDEVRSYVSQVRKDVANASNYDQFKAFISELGMTEDQYWAAAWVIEEQRNALVTQRVGEHVGNGVAELPGETADQLAQRRTEAFRTWLAQQVAQAKVSTP